MRRLSARPSNVQKGDLKCTERFSWLSTDRPTAAKLWLGARAEKDERGFKVKLPLTIQDGFLSMGPLKLARLPVVAWQ